MATFKGILVDLDGTLADSLEALQQVYLDFLAEFGIIGTQEEFQELNGPKIGEIVSLLRNRYHLTPTVKELEALYQKLILDCYAQRVQPYPFARETLAFIKKKNYRIALVTAAKQEIADSFLKSHQLLSLFDIQVTAHPNEPGKPHPALFVRALKTLGIRGDEALAIEDSLNGIKAALSAGIFALWMTPSPTFYSDQCLPVRDWQDIYQFFDERL
jgi:mannitol-1-/sugar-/sorbitol-6-/2-deoxyglucose-6-phosphatase